MSLVHFDTPKSEISQLRIILDISAIHRRFTCRDTKQPHTSRIVLR